MLKLFLAEPSDEGAKADLVDMDTLLRRLLLPMLLGHFPMEVLHRWAYLRCCVGSAVEGEYIASLETMHFGVVNLASIIGHPSDGLGPEV